MQHENEPQRPSKPSLLIGRSPECDIVSPEPTVSAKHARLTWNGKVVTVEDLESANGTFIRGVRVGRADVLPGEHVRIGRATLSWSHPAITAMLPERALPRLVDGIALSGRRFICGACGTRGMYPEGFDRGELLCSRCHVRVRLGTARASMAGVGFIGLLVGAALAAGLIVSMGTGRLRGAATRLGIAATPLPGFHASTPQEASIRSHTAEHVVRAIDFLAPLTRNTAVQVAANEQGPFRIEQVATLWTHVRGRWRYVNDPQGAEYFARASETIENGYAGDCDDFAALLVAMTTAIGGRGRIVMMDGPKGGHAYAEVCVPEEATDVARRLARYYRHTWDEYLGAQEVNEIHFRHAPDCGVWLNLDWNAGVPGGPYQMESWAVAIYPDGRTETLAPAGEGPLPIAGGLPSALPPARPH